MPNIHRKHGPFSKDSSLANLDARTRAGRVMKTVVADLVAHIGDPTPGQRLLIQAVGVKATRLMLLSDGLLNGKAGSEDSDNHCLAWLNSMRLDLQALGLERKATKAVTLTDYIAKTEGEPSA